MKTKTFPTSTTVIDMTEITLKNGITVCYTVTEFEGNYIVGFHSWSPWGERYSSTPFDTYTIHYLPDSEDINYIAELCSDYMDTRMNEGESFFNKNKTIHFKN